jgi:death-on-curing family protein
MLVQAVDILNRTSQNQLADVETAKQAVKTISDFVSGFSVLDNYDNECLDAKGKTATPAVEIGLSEFLDVVQEMKPKFATALFGVPKDDTFASSVGQIYQSFGGKDLYPTLEEKAATLLYLVVKNHSFADGNKRIAASCFIYFLARNNLIYTKSGAKIIDDGALAALTLLIAESKPAEMETMRRVVISILNLGGNK